MQAEDDEADPLGCKLGHRVQILALGLERQQYFYIVDQSWKPTQEVMS